MPTFGYIKRTYPRLEILRGWDPNEPRTRTAAYPVKDNNAILSGMLITPVWVAGNSRMEWEIADKDTSGIAAAPIYIAQDDYTDETVIEAGNLVGLSCAGQFEVETAFYKSDDSYVEGSFLTIGDNGKVRLASTVTSATGEAIVGQVTRAPGGASSSAVRSLVGINSGVINTNVLTFNTMYIPATD